VERGYRADAAVVAEPSAPPAPLGVIPATPGIQRFLVHVEGRAGHPGMRGESVNAGGAGWRAGVNAIDRGVQIHAALRQLEQEWALSKTHPLFKPGQFAIHPGVFVGSPKGRLEPFVVADTATLDYIAIHHPDETPDQVRGEIERQIAAACALDGWLREHPARVEWVHAWPQSVVDASHPIVTATAEAHRAALGREAVVHGWTAVHDGTYLNLAGIPAIAYGPGDVRDAHTTDESVSVDELLDATRTFAVLALQWCGATTR
jgi:acetylornithine deacetylase